MFITTLIIAKKTPSVESFLLFCELAGTDS